MTSAATNIPYFDSRICFKLAAMAGSILILDGSRDFCA